MANNRTRVTRLGHLEPEGAFNNGIEVWQEDNSKGTVMIRKAFRRCDLPDHARREISVLRQLADCPNIVRMYASHVSHTRGEIFMECCGYGTIKALIRAHIQRRRLIPESFIWHVFHSLVEAVHFMQYGRNDDTSWNWIYHRDLHPGNIFITGNRRTRLDVVVGDFGSAVSRSWWDEGRVDMQAVAFGIPETRMNATSDIYQIGLVVVAMCQLTLRPLTIVRPARGGRPTQVAGGQYSPALSHYLERCLRTRPFERVSVKDLRRVLKGEVRLRGSSHDPQSRLIFPRLRVYER